MPSTIFILFFLLVVVVWMMHFVYSGSSRNTVELRSLLRACGLVKTSLVGTLAVARVTTPAIPQASRFENSREWAIKNLFFFFFIELWTWPLEGSDANGLHNILSTRIWISADWKIKNVYSLSAAPHFVNTQSSLNQCVPKAIIAVYHELIWLAAIVAPEGILSVLSLPLSNTLTR